MKKSLFLSFVSVFLGVGLSFGQVSYGLKAAANVSKLIIDNDVSSFNSDTKVGFLGGLYLRAAFSDNISVQPELLYSGQGGSYRLSGVDSFVDVDIYHHYVNLPILFQYQFFDGFRGEVGPQFGYLISSYEELNEGGVAAVRLNSTENHNRFDIGLAAGVSYQIPFMGVGGFARYNQGFLNTIAGADGGTATNQFWSIGVSYGF